MAQPPSNSTSRTPPTLIAALALAAVGALLLLIGLVGTAGDVVGLVAMIAGTVLAAPYAERPGATIGGWWSILAAGTLFALAGVPIGLGVESLGGLLTVLGGALVAIAVALGFPARGG